MTSWSDHVLTASAEAGGVPRPAPTGRSCAVRAWLPMGAVLGFLALLPACAPKVVAPPAGPNQYPDYPYPAVPEALERTSRALIQPHDLAWRALQAGDPRAAERGFGTVLRMRPDFYPSQAGLAFVDLARGSADRAVERFDRVLAAAPQYLPALLGRAQGLLRANRQDEALAAFEAVLVVDPSLADVRRRVETLPFRGLDEALADARRAEQASEWEAARAAYEKAAAASPQSGFLYRDLARMEQRLGRLDEALAHARQAADLDPGDAAAYLVMADVHEALGRLEDAIAALEQAKAADPARELDARLASLRDRAALSRLPAEYRAIPDAERVTRGELAALLGVRLAALMSEAGGSRTALITDARNHWALPWIMTVTRAQVMEAFDNHTFQPRSPVRRGDLARVVSRVLALLARQDPALGSRWAGARYKFSDMGAGNLYYPAASLAVTAGILDAGPGGSFEAGRVVSGAEAVEAVARLEQLRERAARPPR